MAPETQEAPAQNLAHVVTEWSGKNVWIIGDGRTPYLPAIIVKEDGDVVVVRLEDGTTKIVNINDTWRSNPPRFDSIEDMAELAHLNEPSILHNLMIRYNKGLIYSYSGLFLVAVNPYRKLPIYTDEMVDNYKGKRRAEMPPHIFAVADTAYYTMMERKERQSILITGESGAGKTENTKRAIQYIASLAGGALRRASKDTSYNYKFSLGLERQILQTNPILEAFGNAQTVKNSNSSRFGKFIRIKFDNSGFISGGNIDWYLLEKGRITHNYRPERNYHIFYQFLKGAGKEIKDKFLISGGPSDYRFIKSSSPDIPGVDDVSEFAQLISAMDIMNISQEEQLDLFRVISAILHIGEVTVAESEEDAAMIDTEASQRACERVCHVLGIPVVEFTRALLTPKIRAGRDVVTQSVNVTQAQYSLESLARAIYERTFGALVRIINKCITSSSTVENFISVLDIAGFEIFEKNSFEQLCINYTNERLQQFFNHHMFVKEQKEYRREGVEWNFIDFGHDLQPTIDLIEKPFPIGVLPLLDEECVVPKATEETFLHKLNSKWVGKSPKYGSRRFGNGFFLLHYAGKVEYDTASWLDKNKDPLNESLVRCVSMSSMKFISDLFGEYRPENAEGISVSSGHKRVHQSVLKKGQFRTVAQRHKEQLTSLMDYLSATEPHFVRCILTNNEKKPNCFDSLLVRDQLRCNGVLEGIRICRSGFPNKIPFEDLKSRYHILASKTMPQGFVDGKAACRHILETVGIDKGRYRIGRSKVFFRIGVLAELEEMMADHVSKSVIRIQSVFRGLMAREHCRRLIYTDRAVTLIQKNLKVYIKLCNWPWWNLYTKIKPLIATTRVDEELRKKTAMLKEVSDLLGKKEKEEREVASMLSEVEEEKKELEGFLESERVAAAAREDMLRSLRDRELELRKIVEDTSAELESMKSKTEEREALIKEARALVTETKDSVEEKSMEIKRLLKEKDLREQRIKDLESSVSSGTTSVQKLQGDIKSILAEKNSLLIELESAKDELLQVGGRCKSALGNVKLLEEKLEQEQGRKILLENTQTTLGLQSAHLMKELEEARASQGELENACSKYQTELGVTRAKLDEEISNKEVALERQRELRESLSGAQSDIMACKSEIQNLIREKQFLGSDLESLKSTMEEKATVETKQNELVHIRDTEIADLKRQLSEYQTAMNQLKAKYTGDKEALRSECENAKKETAEFLRQKKILSDEVETYSQSIGEMRDVISRMENDKKALERERESLINEESKNTDAMRLLRSENEALERKVMELTLKVEERESDLDKATRERDRVRKLANSLKSDLSGESSKFSALEQQANELKMANANLELRIQEEELAKNDLKMQLTSKRQDLALMTRNYERDIASKVFVLEEAKQRMQKECCELKQKCEDLEITSSSVSRNNQRLVSEVEDLKLCLDREHQEVRRLEALVESSNNQLRSTTCALEAEKLERANLEAALRRTEDSLDSISGDLNEKQNEMVSLSRRKADLESELSSLIDQFGDRGKSINDLDKEKRRIEENNDYLKNQLENMEKDIARIEEQRQFLESQFSSYRKMKEEELIAKENLMENIRCSLMKEVCALGDQLHDVTVRNSELVKNNKKLEEQLKEMSPSTLNLTRDMESTGKIKSVYETRINDLMESIAVESKARKNFEDMSNRFEKRVNALQKELEVAEKELEESKKERKAIDRIVMELKEELEASDTESKGLREEKKRIEARMDETTRKLYDTQAKLQETESSRVAVNPDLDAAKNRELRDLKESLDKSEHLRKALIADQRLKASSIEYKDNQIESLQKCLNPALEELKELKDNLEKEKAKYREENSVTRKQASELKDIQMKLDSEVSNGKTKEEIIYNLKSKVEDLMAKVEEAEIALIKSKKDVSQCMKITELEEKLEECRDMLRASEEKLQKSETELTIVRESELELQLDMKELQKQMRFIKDESELKSEAHKKEMIDLELSIEALKEKGLRDLRAAELELDIERETVGRLRSSSRLLGEKLEKNNAELDESLRELALLRKERDAQTSKSSDMSKTLKDLSDANSQLGSQLEMLTEQNSRIRENLEALETRNCELEKGKLSLAHDEDTVVREMNELHSEVISLRGENGELKVKIEEQTSVCDDLSGQISDYQDQVLRLKQLISDLEEDVSRSNMELGSSAKKILSLERRVAELDGPSVGLHSVPEPSAEYTIKRLGRRLEEATSISDAERGERMELMKEIKKCKRSIESLQLSLTSEQKTNSKLLEQNSQLESKAREMRRKLLDLETQIHDKEVSARKAWLSYESCNEQKLSLEREVKRLRSAVKG